VECSHDPVGTIELDARFGNWSFAPAYEVICGGYGQRAVLLDVLRLFQNARRMIWIGVGSTPVKSTAQSETIVERRRRLRMADEKRLGSVLRRALLQLSHPCFSRRGARNRSGVFGRYIEAPVAEIRTDG
jgi:hypothetical protein